MSFLKISGIGHNQYEKLVYVLVKLVHRKPLVISILFRMQSFGRWWYGQKRKSKNYVQPHKTLVFGQVILLLPVIWKCCFRTKTRQCPFYMNLASNMFSCSHRRRALRNRPITHILLMLQIIRFPACIGFLASMNCFFKPCIRSQPNTAAATKLLGEECRLSAHMLARVADSIKTRRTHATTGINGKTACNRLWVWRRHNHRIQGDWEDIRHFCRSSLWGCWGAAFFNSSILSSIPSIASLDNVRATNNGNLLFGQWFRFRDDMDKRIV